MISKKNILAIYLGVDQSQMKYLKNILLMNSFVNYMIKSYSNKISRDEIHNKKIKNELPKIPKQLFQNYKKVWNENKTSDIIYK